VRGPTHRATPNEITAELVEHAAAGMAGPAGILADFIYGWVEAVLKGSPDVDDATQEAFLAVLNAVRSGEFDMVSGRPSNWVVKIAVRKSIDFHRYNRRHSNKFDAKTPVDEMSPPTGLDIGAVIDARTTLSALSEEERALLLLRYYEGFSIEEISDTLSISQGTVKSRTFRAYTKLRALIRPRDLPVQVLGGTRGKA